MQDIRKWKMFSLIACTAFVGLSLLIFMGAKDSSNYKPLTQDTFIEVAEKVQPFVVSVTVAGVNEEQMERFRERFPKGQEDEFFDQFRRYFGGEGPFRGFDHPQLDEDMFKFRQAGSGIILRSDGYILTNNHVIGSAENGEITVVLKDDEKYEGDQVKIIGVDTLTDLAVIKIDAKGLDYAEFSDSSGLKVGQWVLAVGDPLEFRNSVTQGIISAVNRDISGLLVSQYIQTTAIINPGNSGGALVDLDGRVVGINQAITTRSGLWSGIGFAIPSNRAKRVVDDLIEHGKVTRGYVGISMYRLDDKLKKHFDYDGEGVLAETITKDGPAANAGIQENDIIVEIDRVKIDSMSKMLREVAAKKVGQKVKFKVFREGDFKTITVKIEARPSEDEINQIMGRERRVAPKTEGRKMGLRLEEHEDPALPEDDNKALLVQDIWSGSPASKADPPILKGDSIYEINGKRVRGLDDLAEAMKEHEDSALVKLHRGTQKLLSVIEFTE